MVQQVSIDKVVILGDHDAFVVISDLDDLRVLRYGTFPIGEVRETVLMAALNG